MISVTSSALLRFPSNRAQVLMTLSILTCVLLAVCIGHLAACWRHYLFEKSVCHRSTGNLGIGWAWKNPPGGAFVSPGWKDAFVGPICRRL